MSLVLVIVALALLAAALVVPAGLDALRARAGRTARSAHRRRSAHEGLTLADPGRERRAEARARELLRSCVNEEEWAMYRDLGFIRVFGTAVRGRAGEAPGGRAGEARPDERGEAMVERSLDPEPGAAASADDAPRSDVERKPRTRRPSTRDSRASGRSREEGPGYAYLLYPHKPLVAYEPATHRLLSEYCVDFPDLSDAVTGSRLPDSDDVLAKWMALTGDEARLLRDANMHLPGRQLDPGRVRRDLWRLGEWERRRRSAGPASR